MKSDVGELRAMLGWEFPGGVAVVPAPASGPDMCPGLVPAPRAKARARRSGFP